ncbi:receptor-type tyrosine-protein phosphatase N2-like [Amphibalanus amphitrite]|uniref:receptor-type tyrosine-protein phosphatase N2-like n=1 Tax=Amphibalanus amphitrite TaxID=1232801 RepID=UPI001C90810D|nr:receptor-type tyrosine-protein phosphatase N2-like [Amphibalanus amphitrite]
MSRGRTTLLLLAGLLAAPPPPPAAALHFIGCLIEDLCEDSERCFNDGVFGRCVDQRSQDEELRRLELSPDELSELPAVLERLVSQGHRWSHIYTQCVLQSRLAELQTGEPSDASACELVNERRLPGLPPGSRAVPALPDLPDLVGPQQELELTAGRRDLEPPSQDTVADEALVRFGPAESEFIEELYLPATYRDDGEALVPDLDQPIPLEWLADDYDLEELARDGLEPAAAGVLLPSAMKRSSPVEYDLGPLPADSQIHQLAQLVRSVDRQLQRAGGGGGGALDELERQAAADSPAEIVLDLGPADETAEYPSDYDGDYGDYGGDYGDYGDLEPIPLSVRSDPEFRRAERLDIKKPGPWFGVNNFAFDYDFDGKAPVPDQEINPMESLPIEPMEQEPMESMEQESAQSPPPEPRLSAGEDAFSVDSESRRVDRVAEDVNPSPETTPSGAPPSQQSQEAGQPAKKSRSLDRSPGPQVDTDLDYVYMEVQNRFEDGNEATRLVKQLEKDLFLPVNTFDNIGAEKNQVWFKVKPNKLELNAAAVASRIGSLRGTLNNELGVTITEAGVGKGSSVQVEAEHRTMFVQTLSIVLGALVAAIVLVVLFVCLARRYVRGRDKIKGLANTDTEASKDYQDLCRSRMAARVTEKTDTPEKPQRVHSLSKESDGTASPTSRSSTSSWSEEPVVSNMDISTGHMVLSYMEDHLKKKDKLEEEWRALCAYEAEPSARTVAALPANAKKNRVPTALPYDHSRVTLNAVTNATGGDYINASTITDHDPRNPAYIATQGPMAQTANDFWQMVWEQGSVVIVMLTRLTENGSGMCHRYWPEEGSELYHIYEVHLVSEHIWCDEYLVRSFYLKNLKTSETRTVTQFHFLAWPENGVPTSTKALLEFRRKVNKSYRGRSCPVIVHCSDGCGRTGTYCLIDMVLNRMAKGAKEIDIAASLEHLRDQRADMVRTRAQFEFVLMAVAEEVHAILKALPQ